MSRLGRALAAAALRRPRWLIAALRPTAAAAAPGLDPQLAAILTLNERARLPRTETLSVPAARRFSERGLAPLDHAPLPMQELVEVRGLGATSSAPGIALRLYRPHRRGKGLLLYFHGGGGVIGSLESHDPWCRFLAHHAELQVASVEYRLAPEHPHPAAIADAITAWRWVIEHAPRLGASRLAVGGDSFGGYLSAVLDQATSRPQHHPAALPSAAGLPPPHLQALIYPLVDLTLASPSIEGNGEGYLLTASLIRWFRQLYWPTGDDASRRLASPLLAPQLPRAAPALLVLAGFDPLIDEGRAYARRLRDEARADVAVMEHADLVHGFVVMTGVITRARQAGLALCDQLRQRLHG